MNDCPEVDVLHRWARDGSDGSEMRELSEHVVSCEVCREYLELIPDAGEVPDYEDVRLSEVQMDALFEQYTVAVQGRLPADLLSRLTSALGEGWHDVVGMVRDFTPVPGNGLAAAAAAAAAAGLSGGLLGGAGALGGVGGVLGGAVASFFSKKSDGFPMDDEGGEWTDEQRALLTLYVMVPVGLVAARTALALAARAWDRAGATSMER
jgi:hypothetical protein